MTWALGGNPASNTITTDGTFICGLFNGTEITNFVSPYTGSTGNNSGACIILSLETGQSVTSSANCMVMELNCTSAQVISNPTSYVASKSETVIVSTRTYDNSAHAVGASDRRIYNLDKTNTLKWKPTGSLSYSNSSIVHFYNMTSGDSLPSYNSSFTLGAIKLI